MLHPEEFTDWDNPELYKHVTQGMLDEIQANKTKTSSRCADPGQTVVTRTKLIELINEWHFEQGNDLDVTEVCFRTLAQFALMFSSRNNVRLSISSPSRAVYILVENGAAAQLVDFVLSNPDFTEKARQKALAAMRKGRKVATRAHKPTT